MTSLFQNELRTYDEKKREKQFAKWALEKQLRKHPAQIEITPNNLLVEPNSPFKVTLKCQAITKQKLIVEVDSFMFKMLNPIAGCLPAMKTQIYCSIMPEETISFEITLRGDIYPGNIFDKETERGNLIVYHEPFNESDANDTKWVPFKSPEPIKSIHTHGKGSKMESYPSKIVKIGENLPSDFGFATKGLLLAYETEHVRYLENLFHERKNYQVEYNLRKHVEEEQKKKKCTIQ